MGQDKKSVVVYGPQASGKTRNAEALRKHFLLDVVMDTGLAHDIGRIPDTGALVLQIDAPDDSLPALHINEALHRLNHEPPGYPFY